MSKQSSSLSNDNDNLSNKESRVQSKYSTMPSDKSAVLTSSNIEKLNDLIKAEHDIWKSSCDSQTYKAVFKCLMAIALMIDFAINQNLAEFVIAFKRSKMNEDVIKNCFRYKKGVHSDSAVVKENATSAIVIFRMIEQEYNALRRTMVKKVEMKTTVV